MKCFAQGLSEGQTRDFWNNKKHEKLPSCKEFNLVHQFKRCNSICMCVIKILHIQRKSHTVDSEIFVRILFSRIALKDILVM